MNAASYTVGSTGGNKEWLDGTLTVLEPEETPFTSMVNKSTDAKGTFYEQTADRLRAVRITGTREGESGPKGGNKTTKRARFGAYLHRWHDTFSVTDVQQAVSEAGGNANVSDEYEHAKAKTIREMKRDIEATCLSNQDTQGGSDEEMKLRGLFKWLVTSGTTVTPNIPADYATLSGAVLTSKADLLESDLNAVLKVLKGQYGGSREFVMLAGNDYVEDCDLFAVQDTAGGSASRYTYPVVVEGGETKKISMIVKIFQSSFGRVVIHDSDMINVSSAGAANAACAAILKRDNWKLVFLEKLHSVDDWKDAGGEGGFAKAIGGLFCSMPRGNGYIVNSLNT